MLLRKPPAKQTAEKPDEWDAVYASGDYQKLWRNDQRHHHRLLASLLSERTPQGRVLDIGCGEGAFYHTLRLHGPSRYLGVDIAARAIERAREIVAAKPGPGEPRFEVGDAKAFETDGEFDVVVFPECMEFLGDPRAVLAHYKKNLAPRGAFGMTTWLSAKTLKMWAQIKTVADIEDEAIVQAKWGGAWLVTMFTPR